MTWDFSEQLLFLMFIGLFEATLSVVILFQSFDSHCLAYLQNYNFYCPIFVRCDVSVFCKFSFIFFFILSRIQRNSGIIVFIFAYKFVVRLREGDIKKK